MSKPQASPDKRYLYYDVLSKPTKIWSGLKHQRHLLQQMLREACLLNRTAVLYPMCIASMHNFGKRQLRPFGDILDLHSSYILQPGIAAEPLDFITEDELEFNAFAPEQIKVIGAEQGHFIDEESDRRYALIIRDISTMTGDKFGGRGNYMQKKMLAGEIPRRNLSVALQMSAPVREAAAQVISILSDNLPPPQDSDFLPRYETIAGRRRMPPGAYACLHLRLGDRVVNESGWRTWVRPDRFLKMIYRFLPLPDAPLYIMSNMENTEYHHELKKRYRIFTARDFPELNRRLPPPGTITDDKYLLFSEIECEEHLSGGTHAKGRPLRSPLAGPNDPDNTFIYAVEELIYINSYARVNTDFLNSFHFSLYNPYLADITKAGSGPKTKRQPTVEPPPPQSAPGTGRRYLIHAYADAGGVLRNKQRLSTLLCEAARSGRIAVITPWRMDARYNQGQAQQRSPADFVDLDRACVYGAGLSKRGMPVRWIMEARLEPNLGERRIIDAAAADDDSILLIRRFENRDQERRAATHRQRAILPAAKYIQALAENIQYQLGNDCLPPVRNALETRTWPGPRFGSGVYHCMQLPSAPPKISGFVNRWRRRSQIRLLRRCRRMFHMTETRVDRKVRLYVIGGTVPDKYRHILGQFAEVYSADDFASLQPFLNAADGSCDLFTVFAVEALIMRDAQIKMYPSSRQLKEVSVTDPEYYITHPDYFIKSVTKRILRALGIFN